MRTVARRSGRATTLAEDAALLHEDPMPSIGRIAAVTGTEPATVTALLTVARRGRSRRPPTVRTNTARGS
ncbi:hypothetical protein RKD26_000033 [Streptomyces calvus]